MTNHLTNPENKSLKWLPAVFLALSCFAFSLSPVPADARQSLPTQIEQVVSTDEKNSDSVSLHKVFSPVWTSHVNRRARDYEKILISIHQKESKIQFESMSEKHLSFQLPVRFQHSKSASQDSDEELPPSELA